MKWMEKIRTNVPSCKLVTDDGITINVNLHASKRYIYYSVSPPPRLLTTYYANNIYKSPVFYITIFITVEPSVVEPSLHLY